MSPVLACRNGPSIPLARGPAQVGRVSYRFSVPASNCAAQQLVFMVRAAGGSGGEIWIDGVSVS
jgi:hypothetical protein